LITTCVDCGSNFIVTASNAAGPWSSPIWLKEIDGIDPDIFFDDDGKIWITNNGPPAGKPEYEGHRALWIQQFDLAKQALIGPRNVIVDKGADPTAKPIWIEGPHIIKKDGWYYLIAAEGGTSSDHSQVVFRSKAVAGPYLAGPNNPILTQRTLDIKRAFPVTATGHADFVQLPDGSWWTVFLANRPYEGWLTNLGRETFMLPVDWSGAWPSILPNGQSVPYVVRKPNLKADKRKWNWARWREDFTQPTLGPDWLMRRNPLQSWLDLRSMPGALLLGGDGKAAFIGKRQMHRHAEVETMLGLTKRQEGMRAGLAAIADEQHSYFFGIKDTKLFVSLRDGTQSAGSERILAEKNIDLFSKGKVRLRITANDANYDFAYSTDDGKWQNMLLGTNGRILATEFDGLLFTGTVIGPYVDQKSP
jgi:xylan 1,4-beta-xylosidase